MYKKFFFSQIQREATLVASCFVEDPIYGSQKNPIKCKALFPQCNLKTWLFYGVKNTEEQSDFFKNLIPENLLVAFSEYYHNHILISKKYYQRLMNFWKKVHRANVLIQNKSAFSYYFLPTFFVFHFFWYIYIYIYYIIYILYIYIYIYISYTYMSRQIVTKGRSEVGKILFIKTFINVAGAAFILCVT